MADKLRNEKRPFSNKVFSVLSLSEEQCPRRPHLLTSCHFSPLLEVALQISGVSTRKWDPLKLSNKSQRCRRGV